jgi:hypothetical protein
MVTAEKSLSSGRSVVSDRQARSQSRAIPLPFPYWVLFSLEAAYETLGVMFPILT